MAKQLRFNSFVMKIFSKSTCNCPVAYLPVRYLVAYSEWGDYDEQIHQVWLILLENG